MSAAPEDELVVRTAARARGLLAHGGAHLQPAAGGYAVRLGPDNRRRAALRFDEAVFRRLAADGVLALRPEGGWTLSRTADPDALPETGGRPGFVEGEATVVGPDGRPARLRANLGESPIAWLTRRQGADGRPLLSRQEAAAAEALAADHERCGVLGRLTMDWSPAPKTRGGGFAGLDPAERSLRAKARVHAALEAAGPGLREVVERVCLAGAPLEAAERALSLPRRSGKALLKLGLQRVAKAYGIG